MRSLYALIFNAVLYTFSLNAYSSSWNFGFKGGVNYSELEHHYDDGVKTRQNFEAGFMAGLFLSYDLKLWDIEAGAYFSQRSAQFTSESKNIDLDYTFRNIEIPVIAHRKWNLTRSVDIKLGGGLAYWHALGDVHRLDESLGVLSSDKAKDRSYSYLGIKNHQITAVAALGVVCKAFKSIQFTTDLRYNYAVINRADAANLREVRNNGWDLLVGLQF